MKKTLIQNTIADVPRYSRSKKTRKPTFHTRIQLEIDPNSPGRAANMIPFVTVPVANSRRAVRNLRRVRKAMKLPV